eukprot:4425305-Lingulodinium_polyedra.AAC.1
MDNAIPIDIIDEQDIGWARQRADRGPTPTRRRVEEGEQGRRIGQRSDSVAASGSDGTPAGDPGPGGPRST